MTGNLSKKALLDLAVTVAKYVLSKLASKSISSLSDKFFKKMKETVDVRAGEGFTLFISNEDIDDIIKIVESLEKSGLLIDGATETAKHEIRNQAGRFLRDMMAPMAASLIAPMACSMIQPVTSSLNAISGK